VSSSGTLPWKPSCIGSQLPKSVRIPEMGLERGPGGVGGGGSCHLDSRKGALSLRTSALLLSPFPTSHDTLHGTSGALTSARESQISPAEEWEEIQISK